jgi:hypothetical protein
MDERDAPATLQQHVHEIRGDGGRKMKKASENEIMIGDSK